MDIILASQSPRRQEILAKLGLPFQVVPSEYEEDMNIDLPPVELVKTLALGKAQEVSERCPEALVIGSDTIVVYQDSKLGKPHSVEEAQDMLRMLQGQKNQIITGVCIRQASSNTEIVFADTVDIMMAPMSEEQIIAYVASGEPMDKAGAYALQEKGAVFIERMEGDFFTAMGLPLRRVAESLEELGVIIWDK